MSIIQNISKTINYGRKNGYKEAACAAWERIVAKYYADYTYKEPASSILEEQKKQEISNCKFSIVVPAYETPENYLQELIESCLAQTYGNWELIIADGSKSDRVAKTIEGYEDARIKYTRLAQNGGISENTNAAIKLATGEYCGLLDHDDLLTKDALYEMAVALEQAREQGISPIMLYSDEDKCDATGQRFYDPHFKLDFNLDLILTNNYICHFLVIKTTELKRLQIRKQYDGAQDFDLVLRVVSSLYLKEKEGVLDKVEKYIIHVPKVLYHWRCHQNSTADNPQSKMYAYEAGRKALADFTKRVGWKADIRHNKHLGFYRIAYRNPVLTHREDLAAVGGYVVHGGKIMTGPYRGIPLFYAGYMNRIDLYQNVNYLDIRNLEINKKYISIYEEITGHSYEDTFAIGTESKLPQWMQELSAEELDKLNKKLSKSLKAQGKRLLLDPESVRKCANQR